MPVVNIAYHLGVCVKRFVAVENSRQKLHFLARKQKLYELRHGLRGDQFVVIDQDVTDVSATVKRICTALDGEAVHVLLIDASCASAAGNNRKRKAGAFDGDTKSGAMLVACNHIALELQNTNPTPIVVSYEMIVNMKKDDKKAFLTATSETIRRMRALARAGQSPLRLQRQRARRVDHLHEEIKELIEPQVRL